MSAPGGASRSESKTSRRKSRKSSTMVHDSTENHTDRKSRPPRSADGGAFSKDVISEFKSQILSKFKEFAITPNTSCSNLEEPRNTVEVGGLSENNVSKSCENERENKSQEVEEVFIHKAKFIASSSESERARIPSEDLEDDVFSTGISDMEEVVKKAADPKPRSEDTHTTKDTIDKTDLPHHWLAATSIVKNFDAKMERPALRPSPTRIGPPVQGRLSLRTMKTSPPCFCLLDEIRKNNLVMREDIFSSSSPKVSEFTTANAQKALQRRSNNDGSSKESLSNHKKSKTVSTKQGTFIRASTGKISVLKPRNAAAKDTEVYEASGVVENRVDPNAGQKQSTNQDPTTSDINALAANIRYVRNQSDEFWRPFNPPHQNDSSEWSNEPPKPTSAFPPTTLSPEAIKSLQETEYDKRPLASPSMKNNDSQPRRNNYLTSERHFNQMNDYLEAKTSTPNRRQEKYVKLPGLAEAFVKKDSSFKDIRIKDGTSFESVNAFEEMSMRNIANQIPDIKSTMVYNGGNVHKGTTIRKMMDQILNSKSINVPGIAIQTIAQEKPETKDVATDFRTPLKNTKTQTSESEKVMTDCFVQCESHILDEADGRNVVKNDHREVMVCDENGDGVQLYNELGHPLTDMDGYLLKDSLGRFLVRLDQYGVPISCTNGQEIYMDDSRPWDKVKNSMSIIHQSRKKPIKRSVTAKKGKARPSLRQLECAMENLRSTLVWAEKISLDSSKENSLNRLADFDMREHSPTRNIKPTLDTLSDNTNSLMAEMKSIARLRNALLEKVNFIVDSRNKLGRSGRNAKVGGKKPSMNTQESYAEKWMDVSTSRKWKQQDRPYSPTYRAIKKLKETELNSGMDSLSSRTLAQHLQTLNQSDRVHKSARVDHWKNLIRGESLRNDLPTRKSGGNQQKTETDLWTDAIHDNNLSANSPDIKRSGGNDENEIDLWNLIHGNSTDSVVTNSNDKTSIAKINRYEKLDEELEYSGMKLISKDTDNLTGVSGFNHAEDSALIGSKLLISLEKEYNLRSDMWMDPWKKQKPTLNRNIDTTEPSSSRWGETRPSIEISSSGTNNF